MSNKVSTFAERQHWWREEGVVGLSGPQRAAKALASRSCPGSRTTLELARYFFFPWWLPGESWSCFLCEQPFDFLMAQ